MAKPKVDPAVPSRPCQSQEEKGPMQPKMLPPDLDHICDKAIGTSLIAMGRFRVIARPFPLIASRVPIPTPERECPLCQYLRGYQDAISDYVLGRMDVGEKELP